MKSTGLHTLLTTHGAIGPIGHLVADAAIDRAVESVASAGLGQRAASDATMLHFTIDTTATGLHTAPARTGARIPITPRRLDAINRAWPHVANAGNCRAIAFGTVANMGGVHVTCSSLAARAARGSTVAVVAESSVRAVGIAFAVVARSGLDQVIARWARKATVVSFDYDGTAACGDTRANGR